MRLTLLGVATPLLVAGCSLVTDFDRFQENPCPDLVLGACELAVVEADGTCRAVQAPEATPCVSDAPCTEASGTCDAAGACVAPRAAAGTACDPGVECLRDEGTCDPAGRCVAPPAPAGSTCSDTVGLCQQAVCDGAGACGRPRFERNDTCAEATPLVLNTDPGPKTSVGALECLRDDVTTSCGPPAAPDAFFTLDLPVPRRILFDLRRVGGGELARPAAVAVAASCGADELACVGDDTTPLPQERVLPPGAYVVGVEVAPRVGGDFPPEFELAMLFDPQDTCNPRTPTIAVPNDANDVRSIDASTVGAGDEFLRDASLGVTRDHVYEIVVERAGRYVFETFAVREDLLAPGESNIGDTVLTLLEACDPAGTALAVSDDKSDSDLYSRIVVTLEPGTYHLVVDGFDDTYVGSYILDVRLAGQLVFIGHDYFTPGGGTRTDASPENLLGNAVSLARHRETIRVLEYVEFADRSPTGEVVNARAAWTTRLNGLGLRADRRELMAASRLEAELPTTDVLVVYEQEDTPTRTAIEAFQALLPDFLLRGGVVVVSDYAGSGSAQLVDAPALIDLPAVPSDITGQNVTLVTRGDPVVAGLPQGYPSTDGSSSYPGAVGGAVLVRDAAGAPVVLRREY